MGQYADQIKQKFMSEALAKRQDRSPIKAIAQPLKPYDFKASEDVALDAIKLGTAESPLIGALRGVESIIHGYQQGTYEHEYGKALKSALESGDPMQIAQLNPELAKTILEQENIKNQGELALYKAALDREEASEKLAEDRRYHDLEHSQSSRRLDMDSDYRRQQLELENRKLEDYRNREEGKAVDIAKKEEDKELQHIIASLRPTDQQYIRAHPDAIEYIKMEGTGIFGGKKGFAVIDKLQYEFDKKNKRGASSNKTEVTLGKYKD